jgi:hypothetical protein
MATVQSLISKTHMFKGPFPPSHCAAVRVFSMLVTQFSWYVFSMSGTQFSWYVFSMSGTQFSWYVFSMLGTQSMLGV